VYNLYTVYYVSASTVSFNYLYAAYISIAELRFVPYINPPNSRLFRSTATLNASLFSSVYSHFATHTITLLLLHYQYNPSSSLQQSSHFIILYSQSIT